MNQYNQRLLVSIFMVTALLLVQCAPSGGRSAPVACDVAPVPSQNWVKVASRPPTYYPRGIAADTPTTFHDGEWVMTEDAYQSRYFIPFHGLGGFSRQALVHEALAARTTQKVNRIAAEDRVLATKQIISNAVSVPVILLSGIGSY